MMTSSEGPFLVLPRAPNPKPTTGYSHGRNLVGDTGDVSSLLFQAEGRNKPCPPTFFSLSFVFGEGSKI